jgi:hypothetical protein
MATYVPGLGTETMGARNVALFTFPKLLQGDAAPAIEMLVVTDS